MKIHPSTGGSIRVVAVESSCDVLIVGGGTGGTAAALALTGHGLKVVLTEETDWVGGQFTSQAVPPDEHPWIEFCGCTRRYREFRENLRAWYRLNGNLTPDAAANALLNPGGGWVSRLCVSPAVAHEVLQTMLAPARASGLTVMLNTVPEKAHVIGDTVQGVTVRETGTGQTTDIWAKVVIDATELGDLLPMTGAEHVVGAESRAETGEPNALDGEPEPENVQGITWCAALGWDATGDHTIERPAEYAFWRGHQPIGWPDKLLSFTMLDVRSGSPRHFPLFSDDWFNLFSYRQIVDPGNHTLAVEPATIVNWPMNDYYEGTVIDVPDSVKAQRLESARQLTLSLVYWLQTECGYPGLRLRPDLTGTPDGLAKSPYIRESRRIRALTTIREQDVSTECNPGLTVMPRRTDSVGVGAYRIDLHPSTNGRPTLDTSALPFQIPVGSLLPVRLKNLLPACENIGVTHIANGCTRLHPVEWNIGEAAGLAALFCIKNNLPVQALAKPEVFTEYQSLLHASGIETDWPRFGPL